MVGVLVGDDDRGDALRRDSDAAKAHDRVADAEPAVDEQARRSGLND